MKLSQFLEATTTELMTIAESTCQLPDGGGTSTLTATSMGRQTFEVANRLRILSILVRNSSEMDIQVPDGLLPLPVSTPTTAATP